MLDDNYYRDEKLEAIANRMSRARVRMEAMGFKFRFIKVWNWHDQVRLLAQFVCVCGTVENLQLAWDALDMYQCPLEDILDPAAALFQHGSFSEKHLRADGYSEAAIAEILARDPDRMPRQRPNQFFVDDVYAPR